MKYYITFGQAHVHPITGESMKDYWVELDAPDRRMAYDATMERFGDYWSMCYSENEFKKEYFPKGNYDNKNTEWTLDELFERKLKGMK